MAQKFKATLVSWDQVDSWCGSISRKIMNKFYPDIIIGIARGGLVPARILSDRLWVKDLISVKTEHWGITATKDGEAVLKTKIDVDIKGKRVLIVDDITDTGESMSLAYNYVKSLGPSEIRSVTMLHISRSTFVPDYYAELITEKNWAWFIFPWNIYEDINNLLKGSNLDDSDADGIRKKLMENYDLDVSSIDIDKIMDDLVYYGKMRKKNGKYVMVE